MASKSSEDCEAYVNVVSAHDNGDVQRPSKGARLKACEHCHQRKVRCDGKEMPGNRCSLCRNLSIDCTYGKRSNAQQHSSSAHIEDLKFRLNNAEKLLSLLSPQIDVFRALETVGKSNSDLQGSEAESSDDERENTGLLVHENPTFLGKSSGVKLVKFAMDSVNGEGGPKSAKRIIQRREEYWNAQPWARPPKEIRRVECNFPDPELMSSLIGLYFTYPHIYLPLLHRPTFEKAVSDNLHQREGQFAAIVLLVCAIGVRFSEDPRATAVPYEHPQSLGWIWFHQSQKIYQFILYKPSLYTIQAYCLSAIFLEGNAPNYLRWTLLGTAIRLAQDVGAHTKRKYGSKPTVQGELWKRAFWILVLLDRGSSGAMGRRCATQEEDFDLNFPIECDDEFWAVDDPEVPFRQPPGLPTQISFFVWMIKLENIKERAIRKPPVTEMVKGNSSKDSEKPRFDVTDAALKSWVDSLPDHLRWDPNCTHPVHLKQSALLRASYYAAQIDTHQPFIESTKDPLIFASSTAICSKAAKACVHLVSAAHERLETMSLQPFIRTIFLSAVHLLLSMWREKRSPDEAVEMKEVNTCIRILRSIENRWGSARRLRRIMEWLLAPEDLSNRRMAMLTLDARIPQISGIPQDRLGVLNSVRPKNDFPRLVYVHQFPITFLTVRTVHPNSDEYVLRQEEKATNQITPTSELQSATNAENERNMTSLDFHPTLPINLWGGFGVSHHPALLSDSNGPYFGTGFASNPIRSNEDLEMWSIAPSSNEFEDWSSYLQEIREMVREMQGSEE